MDCEIRKVFDRVICSNRLKCDTKTAVIAKMRGRRQKFSSKIRWAAAAACVLIFAGSGFGGYQLYYTEAAMISIDINPSIELGINRWGRIVETVSYGDDSEKVLSAVSLKHMEYEKALEELLSSEVMNQYLKRDSMVSITLEADGKEEQLLKNLQDCVDKTLKKCHDGVKTEYSSVDESMCEEAHSHGMSAGKYYAIQELLTVDPGATVEEFKDKSMKEIKGHIEHCEHGKVIEDELDDRLLEEHQIDSSGNCERREGCHRHHR